MLDGELAWIAQVDAVQRMPIEDVALRCPADRPHAPACHRLLQGLCHADHKQQIAVKQPREAGVERSPHIGRLRDRAPKRRLREIHVIGPKNQVVGFLPHLTCTSFPKRKPGLRP